MPRQPEDIRTRRTQALRPIFRTLEHQGRMRVWAARQVGISKKLLWDYEHGEARVPLPVLNRLCELVGLPPDVVLDAHPPDLILQPQSRRDATPLPEPTRRARAPRSTMRNPPDDHSSQVADNHPARPPPAATR